jgi:addiction module HigA family antidote
MVTPGEILLEDYLKPMELSQNALARAIKVPPRAINEIVLGKRSITARMSARLGRYFSQSPRFWLNIQTELDVRKALREEADSLEGIVPLLGVAESKAVYGENNDTADR